MRSSSEVSGAGDAVGCFAGAVAATTTARSANWVGCWSSLRNPAFVSPASTSVLVVSSGRGAPAAGESVTVTAASLTDVGDPEPDGDACADFAADDAFADDDDADGVVPSGVGDVLAVLLPTRAEARIAAARAGTSPAAVGSNAGVPNVFSNSSSVAACLGSS